MKITDGAKSIIMEALASNECDCLQVTQQQSCCGTSLNFALIKLQADEIPVSINGVSVMMDSQTQVRAETVTLGAEKGELTLHDAQSCCC